MPGVARQLTDPTIKKKLNISTLTIKTTKFSQNARHQLPSVMVPHTRRMETATTKLKKPENSHKP